MMIMGSIRPVYLLCGDIPDALILIFFGVVGFIHDNKYYLDNGMWQLYGKSNWITMEIGAYILMIIAL